MIQAKRVLRAEDAHRCDHAGAERIRRTIKAAEQASGLGGGPKIGSFFLSNAKSYLVTAKQLMRRIRDKVPYSSGDKMMLSNAGSGWMVEGFPAAAARLQPAGRELQPGRQYLARSL